MKDTALNFEVALQRPFTVGSWRVDPELNRLTEIVSPYRQRTLEPRLMRLLCFLAANPGRVLTRDRLTYELWPRVIVNDNSLTRAVSELRKQLTLPGHAGSDYLQTIPKRGYRLTCTPRGLTGADNCSAIPLYRVDSAEQSSMLARSWRRPIQAAACLLLSVLAINFDNPVDSPNPGLLQDQAFYDQVIGDPPSIVGGQLSLSALTERNSGEQSARTAALSPDGSVLALIRYEGELSTIYLIHSDKETGPIPVFSSQDYLYNLSWSPIGNALLFARQSTTLLPALLNKASLHAELVMLDLDSMSVQVLIESRPEAQIPTAV